MREPHDGDALAETDRRSRWGRVKFGDRRLAALWLALPVGLVLAIGIAVFAVVMGGAGPRPFLGGVVIVLVTVWPCAGLVWALIVDRDTLRGAVADPEQSVESVWYDKAASGAFTDVLLITGLGTTVIALAGIEISTVLALAAVLLVAMGSFGVRYAARSRRG